MAWQGEGMMYTCQEEKVQKNCCSGICEVQDSVSSISRSKGYQGRARKPAWVPSAARFPCSPLTPTIIGLWIFGAVVLPCICLWTCWPCTCLLSFEPPHTVILHRYLWQEVLEVLNPQPSGTVHLLVSFCFCTGVEEGKYYSEAE